jgi:hypothetical protein
MNSESSKLKLVGKITTWAIQTVTGYIKKRQGRYAYDMEM